MSIFDIDCHTSKLNLYIIIILYRVKYVCMESYTVASMDSMIVNKCDHVHAHN